MTPKTDTPKQLDTRNLTDPQRDFIQSLAKKYAEIQSRLTGDIVTVTILDVDEDHRAYCLNPAGNMEYPFVNELKNIRAVTEG